MKYAPVSRLVAFAVVFATECTTPQSSAGESVPSCIVWSTAVRYRGIGYDHIVNIRGACEKPADCEVWTNVNPDKQRVEVSPGHNAEVVTFLASPSSVFEAHVSCSLRSGS